MELDKRIKEGKKPLDCFDTEIAKQFIGKKGYFSHYIDNYADLKNTVLGTLESTGDTFHESFVCTEETFDNYYYGFFLPAEWVKEPEKKYRPYTVMEFIKEYPLGSHLHFRPKSKLMEMHRLIDGYNDCLNGAGTLFICGAMYSMSELYDNYDIFKDGEWHKFGVEE